MLIIIIVIIIIIIPIECRAIGGKRIASSYLGRPKMKRQILQRPLKESTLKP
jgi:hypothetical protein